MALTYWEDFDDFFADPWRHHNRDLWPYWKRHSPWRGDFAFDLYPRDLAREFRTMDRRARELERRFHTEVIDWSPITNEKGFQVSMDVQQFSPSEITVKTNEYSVTIEGKHEERQDEHGFISRHFSRRYALPPGFDHNTVTSELSSDGILTIKAPSPKALEGNERNIRIHHTGPARVTFKDDNK